MRIADSHHTRFCLRSELAQGQRFLLRSEPGIYHLQLILAAGLGSLRYRARPDVALHGEISEKRTVDVGLHRSLGLCQRNKSQADGMENASMLRWLTPHPSPSDRAGVCSNQRKQRCLGWNVPTDGKLGCRRVSGPVP
ncbi:uncharacterized [Tachysurus ichikawai]